MRSDRRRAWPDGEGEDRLAPLIDAALVRRLVAAQMPHWAGLPIRAADPQGWGNRTFRLGSRLGVRLPSAPGYVAQVTKELRVLPLLAAHLPLPIPVPMALGEPGEGYPFAWSVYRWWPAPPPQPPSPSRSRSPARRLPHRSATDRPHRRTTARAAQRVARRAAADL